MSNFIIKTLALAIFAATSAHAFYDQKGGNRGQFVAFFDDKGNATGTLTDSDKQLNTQIQSILKSDKTFAGINASIKEGTVTLTGMADNLAIKSKAESLVRGLKGVTHVDNRIQVK